MSIKGTTDSDIEVELERKIDRYAYIYFVIIGLMAGYCLVGSYFEMQTFNRFSTKKCTYIEALFSNLRICADADRKGDDW